MGRWMKQKEAKTFPSLYRATCMQGPRCGWWIDSAWSAMETQRLDRKFCKVIFAKIKSLIAALHWWLHSVVRTFHYRKVGLFLNFGGKCATLYLTNYSLEKEKLLMKYPYFPKLRTPIEVKFPSQPCRLADIGRCIFTRRLRNNPTLR